MDRRLPAVALVLLVALAGCAGGPLGGGTTTTDQPTDTQSDSQQSDAPALADQSWTDGEAVAFDALLDSHAAVIGNATSFRRTANTSVGAGQYTSVSVAANRESERIFLDIASRSRNVTQIQETYVADGTLYAKSGTESDPRYSNQTFGGTFEQFVGQQARLTVNATVVAQWDWEYAGYEDGSFRFTADSATADPDAPASSVDVANATDVSGTLVVDERGFVRELTVELTVPRNGERQTLVSTTTYGGVNGTTVEEPDWLSKA